MKLTIGISMSGNYVEDWVLGIVQKNINKAKVVYKKPLSDARKLRDSISTLRQKVGAMEQVIKAQERQLERLLEGL